MVAPPRHLLLTSALMVCVALVLLFLPRGVRAQDASPDSTPDGRELFFSSCASCHGADGRGTEFGPSLEEAGAAAADFQLRTGRMPLADVDESTVRKPPAFDDAEIDALVAYVTSLGEGPEIPVVAPDQGDASEGQLLFIDNCAPCHGATGNGGAVGPNALAPSLNVATPVEIAEAMITGPGEMPVFTFDDDEVNDILAFLEQLRAEDPPGGADIGGIGPVPEGFVAWGIGVVALVGICILIGSRRRMRRGNHRAD
ncbi:MAG: cytochrome bc1 complex diheme cytochrome c subunit [Actinomycetota bacterium]